MSAIPFRKKHLLELLESYQMGRVPIDFHVSSYFRAHKALGSKDRAFIAEEVYRLIRWKDLIDVYCKTGSWLERIDWLATHNVQRFIDNEAIPIAKRLSIPQELYDALVRSW